MNGTSWPMSRPNAACVASVSPLAGGVTSAPRLPRCVRPQCSLPFPLACTVAAAKGLVWPSVVVQRVFGRVRARSSSSPLPSPKRRRISLSAWCSATERTLAPSPRRAHGDNNRFDPLPSAPSTSHPADQGGAPPPPSGGGVVAPRSPPRGGAGPAPPPAHMHPTADGIPCPTRLEVGGPAQTWTLTSTMPARAGHH